MKKEKIKFPLSRKIALMVVFLALILGFLLIVANYIHYQDVMLEHYEHDAMNIGAIAASQIDPDRIQHYLDTGERDEEYERVYRILSDIRANSGTEYLYIVKPGIDEVWYVMDTDPSENAMPLGYHEPYYEGAFKENAPRMVRGERIAPIVSNEEFGWLMSVYYPLHTSAGEPAGYVGVDIQMTEMVSDLQLFLSQMIVLTLVVAVIACIVYITITNRTIAEPIRRLSGAANQLVEAEQSAEKTETRIFENLTIRSQDEVGALYRSLSQMERDMNAYIRDLLTVTAERERIGAELNIATQIQADMLPRIFPAFPGRTDFEIYATMTPAKEVGGDFYDFFLIDDDHLGLVMADVSGKGVPAALFMVIAKTLIKNRAQMGGGPAEILQYVNEQLCEGNEAELFVTVWLAIVELSTGKGLAANAGHEHPVIRRGDGLYELVVYRHSPAVAVMEEMRFPEHSFQLNPGDAIFVYTDGVTEATDKNNELFKTDRMLAALNREPSAEPEKLLKNVKDAIDSFVGDAPQFDDITMMCIQYTGPEAEKMKELTIEARVENLSEVLAFVDGQLEEVCCPMKTQVQLDVAVEEIFVNIANYAYTPNVGSATIRTELEPKTGMVAITFIDTGIPYDPLKKEDPDVSLPVEERQIGGLGIYMVKKSMDDMLYKYKDGQNILTIKKCIR